MRSRAAVLLVVGLLVAFVPTSHGATAEQPLKMSVTAGYDGRYLPDTPPPVSVRLESARALAGNLEVSFTAPNGAVLVRSMRVEVPAGGNKRFDLLGPPLIEISGRLLVEIRDQGSVLARTGVSLVTNTGEMLVGVIAEAVPPGLHGLREESTGTPVHGAKLPENWVSLGRPALEPLAYVVVDGDRALTDSRRKVLIDWVVAGGRLLIAAGEPNSLDWLPERWKIKWVREGERWRPALESGGVRESGRAAVRDEGLGQLIVAPEPLTALADDRGFWESVQRPARRLGNLGGVIIFSEAPTPELSLADTLSARRGIVRLRWFMVFLLSYLALAGPINYLILRRWGRKELAWLTIPALAIAFSGVGYGVARGVGGALALKQAGVIFATPEGAALRRVVTVSSSSGGRKVVGFSSNDAAQLELPFERWDSRAPNVQRQVSRLAGPGSEVFLDLNPFSIGVIGDSFKAPPGHLEATLIWDGSSFLGQVTNRTSFKLHAIIITPGQAPMTVGDLDPGKRAGVRWVPAQSVPPRPWELSGRANGLPGRRDDEIRFALLDYLKSMLGRSALEGLPLVVGYTDSFRPPLLIDGKRARPSGMSIFATPVEIEVPTTVSGRLPIAAGRIETIRTDIQGVIAYASSEDFRAEEVSIYRLPPRLDLGRVSAARLVIGSIGHPQQVAVYDFKARSWMMQVAPQGFSELSVSTSVISASGEVYFRLIAQDPQTPIDVWALGLEVDLR